MSNTANLNLMLVAANQAQKEVTVNTALTTIDAILNCGAISFGVDTPPVSPIAGDLYIIGSSPTGAWADKANQIAYYQSGWKFIVPKESMAIWVNDEDVLYRWDGSIWSDAHFKLGINTSADNINKLAVKSEAVLFDNDGGNAQVKVNKNAAPDTASHLFQSGYSGRAEFGLVGDDDFQVKVSPDGSSWHQSYIISRTSGEISFKKNADFEDNIISRALFKDCADAVATPASSSGVLNLNFENGNVFEISMNENITTVNISNPPAAGRAGKFTLILKQDTTGGRSISWPASIKWAGGVAPTLTTTANKINILQFITTDAGTKYYGSIIGVGY